MKDNSQRNIGWVFVCHDDSTQQAYENSLRKSEEKFKAIADYTADWENWIDPAGELLWVNPAVERITGYTVEEYELQGGLAGRLKLVVIEEDLEKIIQVLEEALSRQNIVNDIHFRIKHKAGEIRWVSLSCLPHIF